MADVVRTATGTVGSENVFADLGLPNADIRLRKSKLASKIDQSIIERGLTTEEASARMGIAPERLSDLRNGRTTEYAAEDLDRLLESLSGGG
jgi:predicted XRE-type DNA-binding protein